MNICRSNEAPFLLTLSYIEGKWKLRILYELACEGVLRYGALKRNLAPITHKMLTAQLKALEADGMILRQEYPQIPPKVEYRLSPLGTSFIPILNAMCDWGKERKKERASTAASEKVRTCPAVPAPLN